MIILVLACLLHPQPADAHILQYLSWFRVERVMELSSDEIRLTYECRFDEAASRSTDPLIDVDADSTVSQHERADFCLQAAQSLASDLILCTSGTQVPLREESFCTMEDGLVDLPVC